MESKTEETMIDSELESFTILVSDSDDDQSSDEKNIDNLLKPKKERIFSSSPKKKGKCDDCGKSFTHLRRHIFEIHNPTFIGCPVKDCKRKVVATRLSQHINRVHNQQQDKSGDGSEIEKPVVLCQAITSRRPSECSISTVYSLASTSNNHHDDVACDVCRKRIFLSDELSFVHKECSNEKMTGAHNLIVVSKRKKHNDGANEQDAKRVPHTYCDEKESKIVPKNPPKLNSRITITDQEMRRCPACEENFPNKTAAREHYLEIHGRETHKCKYCNKYFTSRYTVQRHINEVHKIGHSEL